MSDTKKLSLWDIEGALLGKILCLKATYSSRINKYSIVRVEINNRGTVFNLHVLFTPISTTVHPFSFSEISNLISGKTVCIDHSEYRIEKN